MKPLNRSIIPILSSLLILPIAAATLANPSPQPQSLQPAKNLSLTQIRQLAQAITVKVLTTKTLGSAILIAKQGTTYTVLTNAHVLNAKGSYRIQTPDGKIHNATVKTKGNSLQGNDLAILQFSAPQNYRIVSFATAASQKENQTVYAAGFPIDSQQLLITSGKISLIAPKPLVGGYQIGYTNQIKQGMSGGALLNEAGELVAVNGLLNYAILKDTYTYQDGSKPSEELRQRLQQLSFAVPIQTLERVAANPPQERSKPQPTPNRPPSTSPALSGIAGEVDTIANQITVRIDSKSSGNGSGVIIAHQGQTYYILTAFHVVRKQDQYTVVTPDGQAHPIAATDIVKEQGLDVAILKFNSPKAYTVATLSRYNFQLQSELKNWIFFSGFAASGEGKRNFYPGYTFSKEAGLLALKDTATKLSNGYELVFSNLSLSGMSGGPLLDNQGRVIGIGGRSEAEAYSQTSDRNLGYALGVPINTGLGLATKAGIKKEWMKIETSPPPTLTDKQVRSIRNHPSFTAKKPGEDGDETEWLNYGNQLWRLENYDQAVAALQQAIKLNGDFYQAYYVLGIVQQEQAKYPEAIAAFKQVVRLKGDYYQAWREQSDTYGLLKNYPEALAAIEQAIKINREQANNDNPQDFILYLRKSNVLSQLKRYAEAEAALTEAIKLNPELAIAYNDRGVFRYNLKNYPAADADFNQAIKLNPELAEAYASRGFLRATLENYPAAEADFNQAIKLNSEFAFAYASRGFIRYELKNYPAAEADFNQAIKLNSEFALAYYGRGFIRYELKNYPAAEADLQTAAQLFRKQNNPDAYQEVQQLLTKLQALPK